MATVSEPNYTGEFIIGEFDTLSKDDGVLISGQNVLAGTVLGRIETAAATAAIVGTGNGAIGTVTVGAGAQTGVYVLAIKTAGTNVFTFEVKDPQGDIVGTGANAVAFVGGGLSFTLADGATDFIVGDVINITVAAGSLKYTLHDNAATNGSQVAAAIAYANYDASGGDVPIVVITRNQEVNFSKLIWKSGISAGNKTLGIAQLAVNHIIVREVA
jgi:hypothetical protein